MSENKKYFHFCRSFFYSSFVIFLTTTSIYADNIYSTATIEVLAYDSIVQEIINTLADIDNLNKIDKVLLEWLKEYPEFEYIIRINSKGKIISKVSKNKILPRDFKYIGNQKWFIATELLGKPYYGNVIQNNDIYLFWNRPAFFKSRRNTKFAGVLSVKINLKKCFGSIAKKNNLKLSILYGNQTIFTNLKETNSENNIIRKLSIYGLPDLFIKYEKSNPEPEFEVSEVEEKQEASQLAVLQSVVSKVQEEKTAGKIKHINSIVDKILHKKSNPIKLRIFLYMAGICLLLFGLCIFLINRAVVNLTSRKI